MFKITTAILIILVSFLCGIFFHKAYQKQMSPTYDEVMLRIPKTENELKKQYLISIAQQRMLEEMLDWNNKTNKLQKGEKK